MEEKIVLIETVEPGGRTGNAKIIDTGESTEFLNAASLVLETGKTKAIAMIQRIVVGNPPKEKITAILTGKG